MICIFIAMKCQVEIFIALRLSMNNPTLAEYISFPITNGSYYFICVKSYQGGGSNMYYYLHVETSAVGIGYIDDFPDDARTVYPSLNIMCNATV